MIFGTPLTNDDMSWCFFQFFKIFSFQLVRRVKGHKIVQNNKKFCYGGRCVGGDGLKTVQGDKKFCPSRSISQKTYII